eukprot:augustus_masked-scaffold_7-processed-gene-13.10-mRNA-1 protein AED:0.06 eAED:0.06 QI:0/-1/0/1/-1/1/1/0/555
MLRAALKATLAPKYSKVQFQPLSSLSWANIHPDELGSTSSPHKLQNLVNGDWKSTDKYWNLVDPLDKNTRNFIHMPDTSKVEGESFINSLNRCPKSGLHNPLKNPDRYQLYADISFKAAVELSKPEVEEYFIKAIQKVMPKSYTQAYNEVHVSRIFLKTFAGDAVRFMARGFVVSGDHEGQESNGYRFPFGPVACVAPFNFPFEIPVLQLMGALFMGNKLLVKGSEKTSFVLEQYIRLLHYCGMPMEDLDLVHCHGETMEHILTNSNVRLTQFTGSSKIAEHLMLKLNGKVKIEDAGFDWKILGPDIDATNPHHVKQIAYVCDQDAYAMSGQKCSAQSILFAHENYVKAGIFNEIELLAGNRSLSTELISPVLSLNNDQIGKHIQSLLKLEGAKLLFGGELSESENHNIPEIYASYRPTAVYVPLSSMLNSAEAFELCTTEIFGPFQVVTEYKTDEVDKVIECCERMSHHLTAAIVSNDQHFLSKVLGSTVNGTTYAGWRGRTTGAPANHWFGPANDPRGAGIGTPEAIRLVWSCHREIIRDYLLPRTADLPAQS